MDESGKHLERKEKIPMKDARSPEQARAEAERTQRVPGTENYRLPEGAAGPSTRASLERDGILGHDNLEAETEIEKDAREQGRHLDASNHRQVPPTKLD